MSLTTLTWNKAKRALDSLTTTYDDRLLGPGIKTLQIKK